jgi:hypothetical protein
MQLGTQLYFEEIINDKNEPKIRLLGQSINAVNFIIKNFNPTATAAETGESNDQAHPME